MQKTKRRSDIAAIFTCLLLIISLICYNMDDAYALRPFFKSRKAVPELDHAKFRSGAGSAVSDSDIGTVLSDI